MHQLPHTSGWPVRTTTDTLGLRLRLTRLHVTHSENDRISFLFFLLVDVWKVECRFLPPPSVSVYKERGVSRTSGINFFFFHIKPFLTKQVPRCPRFHLSSDKERKKGVHKTSLSIHWPHVLRFPRLGLRVSFGLSVGRQSSPLLPKFISRRVLLLNFTLLIYDGSLLPPSVTLNWVLNSQRKV